MGTQSHKVNWRLIYQILKDLQVLSSFSIFFLVLDLADVFCVSLHAMPLEPLPVVELKDRAKAERWEKR